MSDKISILGSTGSIGRQTLEVAELLGVEIAALAAGRNTERLEEQVRKFRPELVCVFDEDDARDFCVRINDTNAKVVSGMGGLIECAAIQAADTVVTAVVGNVGLMPTLAAIKEKKRIALANKETLVCAGEIVMAAARENGAEIIPVDSEHSAIFQSLAGGKPEEVKKIILTASGGAFYGKSAEELKNVTPVDALKNPNWDMGAKVTVDSATMMNKGLELIEAMHLFFVSPDMIDILVHRQSIVHSMVMYKDNSVIAQLGVPDMRLPIQHALTYPERRQSLSAELNLAEISRLTFEKPDTETFCCLRLAREAAERGGTACAVLNSANEEAVSAFLKGKIRFVEICELVSGALDKIENIKGPSVGDIQAADFEGRRFVAERVV